MRLRNLTYQRGWRTIYQAPVPVIAVGNLSMGGTGKTPLAEYLLRHWQGSGSGQLAYLSRGYGRNTQGFLAVTPDSATSNIVGDEALQVAHKFPNVVVAVCEKRSEGMKRLLAEHDIRGIVLDDAFQHRKVHRDQDWVMIDAQRLPHQDAVLPAGRLREPIDSLRRADLLIFNRVQSNEQIVSIRQQYGYLGKPMRFCRPELVGWQYFGETECHALATLADRSVVLFSGIGHHAAFARSVAERVEQVVYERSFRDHHRYQEKEWQELLAHCPPDGLILTTEKDYYRLQDKLSGQPWAYLPMELTWWEAESDPWELP